MFDTRFEVYLADTARSRRIHYQIRYRIFCIDTGFENPAAFHLGEEMDEWDEDAIHFLVREKSTGQWVATMRLILPGCRGFPVERLCRLDPPGELAGQREHCCEISRLCMIKRYRGRQALRRQGNRLRPVGAGGEFAVLSPGLSRREEPEIMLGLFRAAFACSQKHHIQHWLFLVTPALGRLVSRLGITLHQIGQNVQHRGIRVPYLADPAIGRREAMAKSVEIAAMLTTQEIPHYRRYSVLEACNASILTRHSAGPL